MQLVKKNTNNISEEIFKFIDEESKEIINELILKYPQSQSKIGVKKLKKAIERPDNRENDEFDLFLDPKKTCVEFKYS